MPRSGLSPDAVRDAALALIDDEGAPALTVSAVARRLHVQPASLYAHVRDLAALREAAHSRVLDEVAARVGDEIAGRAGSDALRALADAERGYAHSFPGRWALLQQPAGPAVVASPGARRLGSQLIAVLRGYDLPDGEIVHAARLVGATISGFLALDRVGAFSPREPAPVESWRPCLDALDRALSSWPRGTDG